MSAYWGRPRPDLVRCGRARVRRGARQALDSRSILCQLQSQQFQGAPMSSRPMDRPPPPPLPARPFGAPLERRRVVANDGHRRRPSRLGPRAHRDARAGPGRRPASRPPSCRACSALAPSPASASNVPSAARRRARASDTATSRTRTVHGLSAMCAGFLTASLAGAPCAIPTMLAQVAPRVKGWPCQQTRTCPLVPLPTSTARFGRGAGERVA